MFEERNCGRPRGFTLLEVLVAVAILSGIMLVTFMTMQSAADATYMESARNEIERANQAALDRMAVELRDAAFRVTTIAGDGASVQFQVPVDRNGNGTVLDGGGSLEFGFVDTLGVAQSGTITYRFVQNTVGGAPEVLDEAALNMNLNNNGGMGDRFARGRLVRVTRIGAGAEVVDPIPMGRWVVQPAGNLGGDIDGDGQPDPIFQFDAANGRVIITLWGMHADSQNRRHLVRSTTSVWLRNK